MRTLLLMRHAKSAYPAEVNDDFHRPLSRRGQEDAPRMGRVLAKYGPRPDAVVSSPALRAVATARGVVGAMNAPEMEIRLEERLYQADTATCFQVAAEVPETVSTLLIIGHNPTMEEWVEALCGGRVRLPTGAIAALETPASRWRDMGSVEARMQWLLIPRLVKRIC